MGIQLLNMLCIRPREMTKVDNKDHTSLTSSDSATSQDSSTMSQTTSLHSEYSLQSEFSILSQQSIQSYNSLASVPSLGVPYPLGPGDGTALAVNYRCVATLQGHGGHVFSVATAGNLLYSGSSGNEIRVWKQPELHNDGKFGHGNGAVKSIMVAGEKVYSAHQDHRIRVWRRSEAQPSGHKLVTTIPTVKDYLMTCALPKNYVQVRRHRKALWIEHVDTISVLAVDRKGFLYSGSWDRTVKIWRPSDFKCVESFRAHDDAINALVVSPEGFIYTGSADAQIRVWSKLEGEKKHSLVATLERHKSAINALVVSPEGGILYSGACDRSIIVWEREESAQHMTVAGALRGHKRAILCLAAVGDLLCSGSGDKTVRLWKRGEGNSHSCMAVLEGHRGPVKSIAASVDAMLGYLVYSGSLDHDIKVWWVSCSSSDKRDDDRSKTAPNSMKQINCC